MDTLVLCVAVAVPCSAHSVVFSLVLAGASFATKQTAWLVNNAGKSLQRLQGSIHSVCHVGTKPNHVKEEHGVSLQRLYTTKKDDKPTSSQFIKPGSCCHVFGEYWSITI